MLHIIDKVLFVLVARGRKSVEDGKNLLRQFIVNV